MDNKYCDGCARDTCTPCSSLKMRIYTCVCVLVCVCVLCEYAYCEKKKGKNTGRNILQVPIYRCCVYVRVLYSRKENSKVFVWKWRVITRALECVRVLQFIGLLCPGGHGGTRYGGKNEYTRTAVQIGGDKERERERGKEVPNRM